jgi:hypothetical protein
VEAAKAVVMLAVAAVRKFVTAKKDFLQPDSELVRLT